MGTASRAKDKIASDHECDWRQITDLGRGSLRTTCGSSCDVTALLRAYDKVAQVLPWKFLRNNWVRPHDAYADLHGLVAVPVKGIEVICELQIQMYNVEFVKSSEENAMYELKSQILRGAKSKEDEQKLDKSPQAKKLRKKTFQQYNNVWNKCFGLDPYA